MLNYWLSDTKYRFNIDTFVTDEEAEELESAEEEERINEHQQKTL